MSSKADAARGNLEGTTKPKITKSRNGCVTCKQKRLKCDETKPTCVQCKKRNVECGGYKKDYKWKTFEESSFTTKSGGRRKGSASEQAATRPKDSRTAPAPTPPTPTMSHDSFSPSTTISSRSLLHPSISTASTSPILGGQSTGLDHYGFGSGMPPPFLSAERSGSRSPASSYVPSPMQFQSQYDPSMGAAAMQGIPLDLGRPGLQQSAFGPLQTQDLGRWQPNQQAVSHFDFTQSPLSNRSMSVHSVQSASSEAMSYRSSHTEYLMNVFVNDTCDVLSMERGRDNPWRKYMIPMAGSCPSLFHAILALTAFRASARRPEIKAHGIEHKAEALKHLGTDMPTLNATEALATMLALAIAEAFDSSQNLPEQYLVMSRSLVSRMLEEMRQGTMSSEQLQQASFVLHHWLYMDVMSSLTSKTHTFDGEISHDALLLTRSLGLSPPLDSCMGIATSLFPFVGRVANLVRVVRGCQTNEANIVAEAENLKKLLTKWGPIHTAPSSSQGIAEGDVDDLKCTAEAFRWTSLLLLHQSVPEVALRPSGQMANRVLKLLSSVGPESPCMVFHVFPLLVAGCEMYEDQGRAWVMSRWQEMGQLLQVSIVTKCMQITREVWHRRDGANTGLPKEISHGDLSFDVNFQGSAQMQAPTSVYQQQGAPHYGSLTSDALLNQALQQHMMSMQGQTQLQPLQGELLSEEEVVRILSDAAGFDLSGPPMEASMPSMATNIIPRQSPEAQEQLPFEHTVRGSQHWLGVMEEFGWEIWIA